MTRLLSAAGIDAAQWRALTRTYLLMDFRRGGGAVRKQGQSASAQAMTAAGLVVGALINSIVIALLVIVIRDPLTASIGMVTMAALTMSLLVLVDFSGSVIAAEDYWILAPRPVSSRTYFAARLSAVLAYVIGFAAVMAVLPALVFLGWHRLGVGAAAGAIAAVVLSATAGAALVIAVYTMLISRVPAGRLVRVISVVHLLASALSLGGFLVVLKGFDDPRIRDLTLGEAAWIWYMPVTWFAALVPALGGFATGRELAFAGTAVMLTFVLLSLACGRISLDFAARLSDATTAAAPRRRRRLERIPGFSEGEGYAVATLVRAQFQHDLRFRLGILGVAPMMAFYLFIGWDDKMWVDPFVGSAEGSGPAYMALAFLPMLLHGALQASDHWKASWIFWATPADPARLVVAGKNFVTVFVLVPYLLLMAGFWAVFYERIWHALVHAAFVGAGAHMLLQAAVLLSPALPFAKEPQRAAQSSRLFVVFFFGAIFTSLAPLLLPLVYARLSRMILLAAVLAAVTVILERTLHRRARAYVEELEMA